MSKEDLRKDILQEKGFTFSQGTLRAEDLLISAYNLIEEYNKGVLKVDARKIFDDEMKEKGCVSVFKEPNEWGRHWNGGDYGYKVMFKLLESGRVLLTYSTTSEFDYCPVWGSFQRCEDCPDYVQDECLAEPDIRSYEEAAEIYAAMAGS